MMFFGRVRALRKLISFKYFTDIYVIGYPKTGNTWVRSFLNDYIYRFYGVRMLDRRHDYVHFKSKIPRINYRHFYNFFCGDQIRLMLDGELAKRTKKLLEILRGKKVVHLVRDPRDVLVSFIDHASKHGYSLDRQEFFNNDGVNIDSVIQYYRLIHSAKDTFGAYLVSSFEERIQNPKNAFKEILDFIGLPYDKKIFDDVLLETSFNVMKSKQESGLLKDKQFQKYKRLRHGKIGSYLNELTLEEQRFVSKCLENIPEEISSRIFTKNNELQEQEINFG